ncbi:MAG TPA: glycosyltransferase family 4 protein [Vicinamibacterales bacterium]|nr:glycosyltransferase family 4 protein [Vicinamibacterales bacterium]
MFSLHIDTARSWRGGQAQVLMTALGLRERGHRAALVVHPEGVLRQRLSESHDVIPLAPRSEMDLGAAWKLSRVIRQLAPDVVHAHDSHAVAMASSALAMAAPTPRPPLVMSRRVDFHVRKNALSRWKYNQVDCFVCASDAIRRMLVADGIPEERAVVVYDGVDVGKLDAVPSASIHEAFWLPHQAPVVVNVAALVPHKGQRHLVEAAAMVLRQVPDARFVIFGEGELRDALERQIRSRDLAKHALLAGFRADVLALCKTADLFAMSSVAEGLGSALLDAMACGKAVAGTTAGGIPEAVVHGETGLLVPPRDDEALADAIVRLLRDAGLLERFGRAGRARVEEHFSAERMVTGVLNAYALAISRPAIASADTRP